MIFYLISATPLRSESEERMKGFAEDDYNRPDNLLHIAVLRRRNVRVSGISLHPM